MHAVLLVLFIASINQIDTCTKGATLPLDVKACIKQVEVKPLDPAKLNQ
jgi:hypothetical protein